MMSKKGKKKEKGQTSLSAKGKGKELIKKKPD